MYKKLLFLIVFFILFLVPVKAEEKIYTEEEIQTIEVAGTYPVEIYTYDENGSELSTIVYVTVVFDKTILNTIANEGIDAKDFQILKEDFIELTDIDYVRLARAHAWSLETGTAIPIASVMTQKITENQYEITFATEKNTKITVTMYIKEKVTLNMSNAVISSTPRENYHIWSHLRFGILFLIFIPIVAMGIIYFYASRRNKQINKLLHE